MASFTITRSAPKQTPRGSNCPEKRAESPSLTILRLRTTVHRVTDDIQRTMSAGEKRANVAAQPENIRLIVREWSFFQRRARAIPCSSVPILYFSGAVFVRRATTRIFRVFRPAAAAPGSFFVSDRSRRLPLGRKARCAPLGDSAARLARGAREITPFPRTLHINPGWVGRGALLHDFTCSSRSLSTRVKAAGTRTWSGQRRAPQSTWPRAPVTFTFTGV